MTPRQRQCLNGIVALTVDGVPPTLKRLTAHLGLKSTSTAWEMVQALVRQGLVERVPGQNNGLRVIGADFRPDRLEEMNDAGLRMLIAHAAGLLAHREGGYGVNTAEMLRRVADRLVRE